MINLNKATDATSVDGFEAQTRVRLRRSSTHRRQSIISANVENGVAPMSDSGFASSLPDRKCGDEG